MKFDPKELEVKYYMPGPPNVPPMPVLSTPITPRENYLRMMHHEQPLWLPTSMDYAITAPTCSPDAWAHGVVFGPGINPAEEGGQDMLGVEWEIYGPGAMVRQGNPLVKDLDHWEDYVTFPDVDSWDWESSGAKDVKRANDNGQVIRIAQFSGFFERLISLVDMEEALVSMIDEDCAPAIHRLFDYMCTLYDKHFEKYAKYLHADTVWFMDDWGTQRAPFFSIDTIREMLLPYLKRVVESAHKYGLLLDFHSDGKIDELVPLIVESGADSWEGQIMNDKIKVLETYPQLVCNVHMPPIPKDATEEQIHAIVDEFFETYGKYRIVVDAFGVSPDALVYLYEKSRRAYCG